MKRPMMRITRSFMMRVEEFFMILAREEPINGACQKAPKFIKDADGDRLFVKKIKDMVIRKHRRTWLHNVEDSIMEHTAPKT